MIGWSSAGSPRKWVGWQNAARLKDWGYGRCFLIYVFAFIALFARVFIGGEVVTPLLQGEHFGQPKVTATEHHPENAKFSDYVTGYVPEAAVFLQGKRASWIATWNPYNELGRPTGHLSGLSPAYLPNWILSKLTADPFRYVSTIALLQMFLAGAFAFLFARELELKPVAALIAALALGVSPNLIYWATFPMLASAYGWSIALLYALLRLVKRGDLIAWATMVFAVYSLLMTAYPVMVVYHAYFVLGFFIYLALKHPSFPRSGPRLAALLMSGAAAVSLGVLAAAPALLDTFITTLQSSRTHPDVQFFRDAITPLDTVADWQRFFAYWTFPQVLGDPISPAFSIQFNGRSLAPFAVFLICASDWRRTWGWWLATLVLLVMEASRPVFAFAVGHLGLGVSRSVPTVLAIIPLVMISAISLDTLVGETGKSGEGIAAKKTRTPWIPALCYLALVVNACMVAVTLNGTVQPLMILVLLGYLPVLVLAVKYRWPILLISVAVVHLLVFDRLMLLTQPREAIVQKSQVTEQLRTLLTDGGRFAVTDSAADILRPNMNAQVGLPSVHSYDSLSSLRYQALIRRLGGNVMIYGRINTSISDASLGSIDFRLANIGGLLSRHSIASTVTLEEASIDGLHVYRVRDRSGRFIYFDAEALPATNPIWVTNESPTVKETGASSVIDDGDRIVVQFADVTKKNVLIVASQMFNPGWRAEGHYRDGWHPLRTEPVNDAFEGMIVPMGADSVRLRFRPWVLWSWLGHAGFGLLAVLLAYRWIRGRVRKASGREDLHRERRQAASSQLSRSTAPV